MKDKETSTFIVKVMDQQNNSWQGSITWVENDETMYFRSALELLHLMDGAIKTNTNTEVKEN
ncbi:MAG: hypothetical protein IIT46_02790 [Lachnospiraceae bacterium]|nr:hypothetical protein [Lachnospiraceae bacterium]